MNAQKNMIFGNFEQIQMVRWCSIVLKKSSMHAVKLFFTEGNKVNHIIPNKMMNTYLRKTKKVPEYI